MDIDESSLINIAKRT